MLAANQPKEAAGAIQTAGRGSIVVVDREGSIEPEVGPNVDVILGPFGWLGDTAGADGAMHPHVLDAELGTLPHGGISDLGSGSDHDCFNAARDRSQVVVAPIALDFVRVRIDRKDLVTSQWSDERMVGTSPWSFSRFQAACARWLTFPV
jgi:hypothetical protein